MLITSNSYSSVYFIEIIVASRKTPYLALLTLSYCQLFAVQETPKQAKRQSWKQIGQNGC